MIKMQRKSVDHCTNSFFLDVETTMRHMAWRSQKSHVAIPEIFAQKQDAITGNSFIGYYLKMTASSIRSFVCLTSFCFRDRRHWQFPVLCDLLLYISQWDTKREWPWPGGVRTPIALHCGSVIFKTAVKAAGIYRSQGPPLPPFWCIVGELTYKRWRTYLRRWRIDLIRWGTGRWRTDTLAKRPVTQRIAMQPKKSDE